LTFKKLEERWGTNITTIVKGIEDMSDVELFYNMIGYISFFETASVDNKEKGAVLTKAFMERMGYTDEQLEACRDKELEGKLK